MASASEKLTSQSFPEGAQCRGAATEFRARRLFYRSLSAFRSNILDAADLSPAFRKQLLRYLHHVDTHAPKQAEWDMAMAEPAPETPSEPRSMSLHEMIAAAGSGRSML